MKNLKTFLLLAVGMLFSCSCSKTTKDTSAPSFPEGFVLSPDGVAHMLASLPIGEAQMSEVFNAVNSSSVNGYDEEYMMRDLLSSPGSGVGDPPSAKAASKGRYDSPLRDMITDYLSGRAHTKAGAADVEAMLDALSGSGMQIYWPYSGNWNGEQLPLITFDPGFGATSNWAYEVSSGSTGYQITDSVYVDETVAATRPVWVINRNDDSCYTPLNCFSAGTKGWADDETGLVDDPETGARDLYMKSFTMMRQYDSWFAGASEFFIKSGQLSGFRASREEEMKNYSPEITDFMVVVRRSQKGREIPFDAILLSGFTDQMDKIAFMVTEDDGGARTSWKCEATVKIKSRSYGFNLEIPLNTNDDIVWRGQLRASLFAPGELVTRNFGDVRISFMLE